MSTSDPRENGYQGELDDSEDHCEEGHLILGRCPCCGSDNIRIRVGNFDGEEICDKCMDCDWEGEWFYG